MLGRRGLLGAAAAAFAGCSLRARLSTPSDYLVTTQIPKDVFKLGVASGEPSPDGFVLWTRLAPDPIHGGGMPPNSVLVTWEVATDEGMSDVIRAGNAVATPELAHSVHVEVEDLEPATHYWYRFRVRGQESPIGRARTAPAATAHVDQVRFAFASCHSYQAGYFDAYKHMIQEDIDFVAFLGDYIYEGGQREDAATIRRHDGSEVFTLPQYRNRHALYKTDRDLQAAHRAFPFVVTWDDHELENNYAGQRSENKDDPQLFLLRRAAAYQAYYEHMPLRLTARPSGADMLLYRRLVFGDLLELNVLDTRQYRSGLPGIEGPPPVQPDDGTAPSMIGARQEKWLFEGLSASHARWNALAQGVFVGQRFLPPKTEVANVPAPAHNVSIDAWDGYPAARRRLLGFLQERRPTNPVVITGDVHNNWAVDLKASFDDPQSPTLGTEFIGTSISSGADGADGVSPRIQFQLDSNPHIKFYNGRRGYVRCTLTPEKWQTDFRVLPFVTRPGAPISTVASLVVENGRPGVVKA